VADATNGAYVNASNETDLRSIYENLTTQIVFRKQKAEITALFASTAVNLPDPRRRASLLWFNPLPWPRAFRASFSPARIRRPKMTPRIPHFHAFSYNILVSVRHGLQPAEGASSTCEGWKLCLDQ
jgi:hypothetical protein